jgi:hypothetical protein
MAIWTRNAIGNTDVAEEILKILGEEFPEAFPLAWGDAEPPTISGSPKDFRKVISFWDTSSRVCGRRIFGQGKQSHIAVHFLCGTSQEPHSLHFEVRKKQLGNKSTAERMLVVFSNWATIVSADFGRLSLEAEWVAKNVKQQYLMPDGGINPWMVFATNLVKGMPGIYWSTYLSEVFCDWLGREKVAGTPWPYVQRLEGGYLLRRSDDPERWALEAGLDDRVLDYLGRDKFFDINDPKREIHVPGIPIPDFYAKKSFGSRTLESIERRSPVDLTLSIEDHRPLDWTVNSVRYFRDLGFFEEHGELSEDALAARIEVRHLAQWGTLFDPADPLADLQLLQYDPERIWWKDTEADVCPGNNVYVRVLEEWARISRGYFLPQKVSEKWLSKRSVTVEFVFEGIPRRVIPKYRDDYLDVSILGEINKLLAVGRFELYEPFDQTAYVVFLTNEEKRRLERERQWRFDDF